MEHTRTLHERMIAIVAILGADWTLAPMRTYDDRPVPDCADFTSPEGIEFFATANGYRNAGKVAVGFAWPTNARGQQYAPSKYDREAPTCDTSINISLDKTDERIAGDIRRRLYTPALPIWQAQAARAAEGDAYLNAGKAGAQAIAAAFPGARVRSSDRDDTRPAETYTVALDHLPIGYKDVTVTGSGARFEVAVESPADAIRILKAIEALKVKGRS